MKMDKKMGSNEHVCRMCGGTGCNCGTVMGVFGLGAVVLGALLMWGRYEWFTLTNVVGLLLVVKGLKHAYFGFKGGC